MRAFFFLPHRRKQNWEEALHWYDTALNMTDYDEGGEFDGMQDEPHYLLLAREAEMFQEGGFNLTADPQRAGLTPSMMNTLGSNLRTYCLFIPSYTIRSEMLITVVVSSPLTRCLCR